MEDLNDVVSGVDVTGLFDTDEERAVAARILMPLAARINVLSEARQAKRLDKLTQDLINDNKKLIETEIDKIRKAHTPPSDADLQKLLSQEYAEFTVEVRVAEGSRTFTIRELPMSIETKIIQVIRRTLVERLQSISTIEWDPGANMLERLQKVLDVVPGALSTLAECVALCLDPFGEHSVSAAWVADNIGATRMLNILRAQLAAGRYRDFASGISQLTSSTTIQ